MVGYICYRWCNPVWKTAKTQIGMGNCRLAKSIFASLTDLSALFRFESFVVQIEEIYGETDSIDAWDGKSIIIAMTLEILDFILV